MIDFRLLEALLAIEEQGSFSAAARALGTVQSNVSTRIGKLESALGAVLVDRQTGRLTDEGRVVAEHARRIRAELDALPSEVASVRQNVQGQVKVGVIGTTARWLVPRLLRAAAERLPGVRLVVVDATTLSLLPRLATGQLDLAVVNLPVTDPDVQTEPLFEEDHILVVPTSHPLARRKEVGLEELADFPLLLAAPDTAFRKQLDRDAARFGVELVPMAEIDGLRLLASLAFQGFGPAILPASAAPPWVGGDWKRVRLTGVHRRPVGLARRRRGLPTAAARNIASLIKDVIATEARAEDGIRPRL
ncbi:MAG: LysR family transcriptional regulator [Acidimicrobiales bacterium]|nr:MAG: LysR family transcriptional regulator [Acidimicrobiales bacterium]